MTSSGVGRLPEEGQRAWVDVVYYLDPVPVEAVVKFLQSKPQGMVTLRPYLLEVGWYQYSSHV